LDPKKVSTPVHGADVVHSGRLGADEVDGVCEDGADDVEGAVDGADEGWNDDDGDDEGDDVVGGQRMPRSTPGTSDSKPSPSKADSLSYAMV